MISVPQFNGYAGQSAGGIVDVSAPVGVQLTGVRGAGAWVRPSSVVVWHGTLIVVLDIAIPADTPAGSYTGTIQLSCGAPVPIVVHVAVAPVPTRQQDSGTIGLGAVPVARVVAGRPGGVAVVVQNPSAAVTLAGTGPAGRWVAHSTVACGAEREIKVALHVPAGTPDGRYVGTLVLYLAPPKLSSVAGGTATAVVGYRVVQPLVVLVSS
jgi:hypothetical protein